MIFETTPKQIVYKDLTSKEFDIRFELTHDVIVKWGELENLKTVTIPKGFYTNFASVPVIFRNFIPNVSLNNDVTLWHDYMYWNVNHPVSRSEADRVLKDASRLKGIPTFKAYLMWVAVRLFASKYWA